ncbi:MAG TPA: amidohydrolase [Bryobacteraceae bacterium]|nr:amidohydrolase [Bryobacteraceae bacterium]
MFSNTLERCACLVPLLLLGLGDGTLLASDTVLINGHVYTAKSQNRWAEAVAISGDKIEAVGSNAEIARYRSANTKVIDLKGKTVIPGITDGHVHLWFGALALHGFNLSTPESNITPKDPELLLSRIKDYTASHPKDPVIFGRVQFITDFSPSGNAYKKPTVTHELLDRAVPDRPLVIHDTSEHALWVNQKTLDLAHITDAPFADPSIEKNILRDAHGHRSGVVMEGAMEIVERALPDPPMEEKFAWLREAMHYLNSFGITSATMATGNLADIELLGKMRDRGLLTIRTRTAFGQVAVNHHLSAQFVADLEKARSSYHDSWVSANLVKFFSDGLTDPPVYTPAELQKLYVELDKRGYQLMTHSIGVDSARMVLDAYQATEKMNGPRDRRFRMEHADYLNPEDVARFHQLGVIASMQPSFCCNSGSLGPVKIDTWNSLLKAGAMVTFSSDWPCTWPPDPLAAIEETMTREVLREVTPHGPVGPVQFNQPQERLSAEQGVLAYTRDAAYANFAEKSTGTLEPGKFADLAVLSRDIFSAKPAEIGKTHVTMTMVGGKVVFER